MAVELTSKRHRVEDIDAVEFCYQQGWTDGLPVIPPTPDRVTAMLAAARLDPKQEIAFITHRSVSITAEKVAINAVMAGCRPEYLPVVVAAVEGIGDPAWSYHGPGTSTGGAAVLMIVNGPIARQLDINSGDNLFGPGWRASLTVGRALRLVMRNVCGSLPGLLDRGTLGHPGKLSYVIDENEAESPWAALHVERGFRPEQRTVTVMAAAAPHVEVRPDRTRPNRDLGSDRRGRHATDRVRGPSGIAARQAKRAHREHEAQLRQAPAADRRDPQERLRSQRDAHVPQAQL